MKSLAQSLGMLVIMASLVGLSNTGAYGESTKGKWGFGLRGGPSLYTQNLDNGTKGDVGPMVSGIVTYGITDFLSIGFNTEWETHNVDDLFGDVQTLSLLPLVELRQDLGSLTPYAFAGAGLNINWFNEDPILKLNNIELKPDNTFAAKVGAGADYFLTQNWAFNMELGWKYNKGDAKLKQFGTTIAKDNFNASVFSALVGVRYYF